VANVLIIVFIQVVTTYIRMSLAQTTLRRMVPYLMDKDSQSIWSHFVAGIAQPVTTPQVGPPTKYDSIYLSDKCLFSKLSTLAPRSNQPSIKLVPMAVFPT
jgi:hypothetical protein